MTNKLTTILKAEGLEHLIPTLVDQGIVDSMLADLTESDLKTIGIDKLGERKRLLTVFGESKSAKPAISVPSNPMVKVEGGVLPSESELEGTNVESFLIGKYAVTNQEWKTVQDWALVNGFEFSAGSKEWEELAPSGGSEGTTNPVEAVNWYDAVKWCNAKSLMEKLKPVYSVKGQEGVYCKGEFGSKGSGNIVESATSNGYRLPMEAEWEWAARGGCKSQGYTFAGSNDLDSVGWYDDNSGVESQPVGKKSPNELGLYDMSGNVWEWCWDLSNKSERSMRGGNWGCIEDLCIISDRNSGAPDEAFSGFGFRIARSL